MEGIPEVRILSEKGLIDFPYLERAAARVHSNFPQTPNKELGSLIERESASDRSN